MKTIPPQVHAESQDTLERLRSRFIELQRPLVVYLLDAVLAAIDDETGVVFKDRKRRSGGR